MSDEQHAMSHFERRYRVLLGALGFVQKPFLHNELLSVVNEAISIDSL